MHFLPDIYVPCDVCQEQALQNVKLGDQVQGKNNSEVPFPPSKKPRVLRGSPGRWRASATLIDVGLSYNYVLAISDHVFQAVRLSASAGPRAVQRDTRKDTV